MQSRKRIYRLFLTLLAPIALGASAGVGLAAEVRSAPKSDCTFDTCQFPGFCKAADQAEFCAGEQGACYSEECH